MKKQWAVAGAVLSIAFGWTSVKAEELPNAADRLIQLEQRQSILERKYEVDQENAAAKAKETPVVTANSKDGFSVKSPDGSFVFKISGDIQADSRFFLNNAQDTAKGLTDTFLLRRARPTFEASLNKWMTGRLQTNFGQGSATIEDAYINLAFHPLAQFRTGRFKAPFGIENLKSSTRLTFIERALPTQLVPIFDQGVQLWGEPLDGRVGYAFAVTNGAVDGTNVDNTDANDRKEFTGRLFLKPLKKSAQPFLAGLGVGLAGSTGRQLGTTDAPGLTSGYKTNAQTNFFTYLKDSSTGKSRAVAAGQRTRWSPQLTWYPGSFGVMGEYVASRQAVQSTSTLQTTDLTHRAWQVAASYVLTGEVVNEKGVTPRTPYQPGKPGWGALEVAGRYSQFNADDATYPTYSSLTSSAQSARCWTGGLNWYATGNLKLQSNYEYTSFNRGAAGTGNRPNERAILTRIQLTF
jgi:phosphate-selective porin OprO/OprP